MMWLAEHRPHAAPLEHQPLQHLVLVARAGGQEETGLGCQIKQDRAGFEQRDGLAVGTIGVHNGRDLVDGAEGQESRRKLIAGAGADVDGVRTVAQAALLQHDVNLVTIGRGPRIHLDHHSSPQVAGKRATGCIGL